MNNIQEYVRLGSDGVSERETVQPRDLDIYLRECPLPADCMFEFIFLLALTVDLRVEHVDWLIVRFFDVYLSLGLELLSELVQLPQDDLNLVLEVATNPLQFTDVVLNELGCLVLRLEQRLGDAVHPKHPPCPQQLLLLMIVL